MNTVSYNRSGIPKRRKIICKYNPRHTCIAEVTVLVLSYVYNMVLTTAPGPVKVVSVPSLLQITITWTEPVTPNGIITEYQVSYRPKESLRYSLVSTGLHRNFSVRVKQGDEISFSVRAFTSVGPGEPTSVVVSALTNPREIYFTYLPVNIMLFYVFSCCRKCGGCVVEYVLC